MARSNPQERRENGLALRAAGDGRTRMVIRNIATACALTALIAATQSASAQTWPARPITMVVPFAAGASSDILGRLLAPQMSEALGKPVVVENMGGAGGMTGAARVAKA